MRGRDRRRRDRAAAALGPALPLPDPARGRSGCSSCSWALPFEWIERLFGYVGLCLLVLRRRRDQVAPELGPASRTASCRACPRGNRLVYLYFMVGLLGAALTPYEVYFYSSGAVEDGWGPKDLRHEQGHRDDRLRPRRAAVVRADDRRGALFLPKGIDPQFLGTPALGVEARARQDRAASSRSSASSSPSAARRSRRASRARTTSRSSSAGSGASASARAGRRASRSRGSSIFVLAAADRDDGLRPREDHRVLRHLLGRRAAAHVPADPARRERPDVHGPLPQQPARRTCSGSSTSS